MEELYRLKQHVKKRQWTLLESFYAYKDPERYKNTELHVDEYFKVLESIEFKISEENLYRCLDWFEFSSKDRIDYTKFCEEVQNAKNPTAKGLRNIRKFKTMESIYEYLAKQWMVYFPLGHLLKDHDYEDNGTIKSHNLEIILRKGASEMTEGDLHYFLSNISNDNNEVDSQKLIADINYYVKDRDKRQILETHIPAKILNPIGISDS